MLTKKKLMEMQPGIFKMGTARDCAEGLNMTGSNELLKWVAVRGIIHDWAIYCDWDSKSWDEVKANGDKVMFDDHIQKLVPCTDEALALYRK